MTSSSRRQLEIQVLKDRNTQKWSVPLAENMFEIFMSRGGPTVHTVFGDGSLFSPFLFGKFFDPSDAFPLWEFESDVLLSKLRSSSKSTVDWCQTEVDYALKAELPGAGKNSVKLYVEQGRVVEISGQWKQQQDSKTRDWRSGDWWEHGYVRKLELPENADWRKMDAHVINDTILEIRIPKRTSDCDDTKGNDGVKQECESI
ncbi:21.7 kDa class VI heat shock protein [Diospyros lotus]|uniref:21.7 kDa class VI heat shock protein n=1 Tax=Diospyros lotus TaxID=55363 RepID=UPI00224DBA73|nr:21.7 kDa class VI heat shock protein [Diospyros lotus]